MTLNKIIVAYSTSISPNPIEWEFKHFTNKQINAARKFYESLINQNQVSIICYRFLRDNKVVWKTQNSNKLIIGEYYD